MLHLTTLNDTYTHSVGLPWTRNRPITETSICTSLTIHKWQTSSLQRDNHTLDLTHIQTVRDKYVSGNHCDFQNQENISNLDLREGERLLTLTVS